MAWISWDNDEKTVDGGAVAAEDCVGDVLTLLALCARLATGPLSLFCARLAPPLRPPPPGERPRTHFNYERRLFRKQGSSVVIL